MNIAGNESEEVKQETMIEEQQVEELV